MPTRALYASTIFLGAFLLFLIEPIAAKQLLPELGGSSAVWITCLVVFQGLLLLGYSYAHWVSRVRSERVLHVALLIAAAILAFVSPSLHSAEAAGHPVRTIFTTLLATMGLPFLLLSSTSPLLQVWLARAESQVRYQLFGLSNVASLLALFLYPVLLEPHLALRTQRLLWAAGFLLYAAVCSLLALRTPPAAVNADLPTAAASRPALRLLALWFFLPFAASMQLASVTAHLTQNIAPIPLLWIVPLAAYLLSFIAAFQFPRIYKRATIIRLLVVFLAALGYTLSKTGVSLPIGLGIAFFLIELLLACLFCHAEAYALRPRDTRHTTLFYLLLSAGGAAGTFLIGIVSPMVFSANYDLALSFFATAAVAVAALWDEGWPQRLLWSTATVLLLFLVYVQQRGYTHSSMALVRNFYGPLRVTQEHHAPPEQEVRTLINGSIQHGTQIFTDQMRKVATTYYAPDSGIGLAMRLCCEGRPKRVGVVGLGAGTLAAYGKPGDSIRFYEINPAVQPVARNLFTYIRESGAQVSVVEGDGRISLTQEQPNNFDILVVDAFSGDAIPLHLLTTQAVEVYRRHLAPNGILAFHVSNKYIELAPEVAVLGKAAGIQPALIDSPSNDATGAFRSTWVLLTNNQQFLQETDVVVARSSFEDLKRVKLWTDDYSSILPLLNWRQN